MINGLIGYFFSFFQNPTAWGIGLAIAFGAVWLVAYRPPLFKKPWLWAVLVSSAFLTLAAICFIQAPLRALSGLALRHFWSQEVLMRWVVLVQIPSVLISGLVQEGSKLVSMVVYRWRNDKNIDPKRGLTIGAVAGAGFGILQAQSGLNDQFAYGWTWESVQIAGFMALTGFILHFFAIAAHIAFSALAGYGLAKGWGWQFYLIASFLHALLDYRVALLLAGLFAQPLQLEIYAVVTAALVTAGTLWLRWRKTAATADAAI